MARSGKLISALLLIGIGLVVLSYTYVINSGDTTREANTLTRRSTSKGASLTPVMLTFKESVLLPKSVGYCGVSEKLKFIYVHNTKAGGSSVLDHLSQGLCKGVPAEKCTSFKRLYKVGECVAFIRMHPDFLRFSFFRSPTKRTFSVWKFALFWRKKDTEYSKSYPTFGNWVKSPNLYESFTGATTMSLPAHLKNQTDVIFSDEGVPGIHVLFLLDRWMEAWRALLDKLPGLDEYISLAKVAGVKNKMDNWQQMAKEANVKTDTPNFEELEQYVCHHYPRDCMLWSTLQGSRG